MPIILLLSHGHNSITQTLSGVGTGYPFVAWEEEKTPAHAHVV